MYKTISLIFKQSKNKKGANFVTKFKANCFNAINTAQLVTMKSKTLVCPSQKSFSEQRQVFEKLSDKSMGSGKLNLRTTLLSENLNSILTFIEENSGNMNEGDFADAMGLITMKLESDVQNRINFNVIEKRQGFQLVKSFIEGNFDKLINGNLTSQSLLNFMCQLNKKGKVRSVFSREQEEEIVKTCQHNLELNHAKMTINSVVGLISLLGLYRVGNIVNYLRGREEEIANLGFNNTLRYLRRLTWKGMNTNTAIVLTRFLTRDFFQLLSGERLFNKTKAFAVLAKLDSQNPYVGLYMKLSNLLKEIRAQAENHDQFSILSLIEGLAYYEDASKPDTLRELYDIVTMTIKHQPENIRSDFILDFMNYAAQIKRDNKMTEDHLKTLLDYTLNSIRSAYENNQRTPNVKKLIPVFTLMRKHKFADKELAAQFFELVLPRLLFLPEYSDIKSIRFVLTRVLGEDYVSKVEEEVPSKLREELDKSDNNIKNIMALMYKASAFVRGDKLSEVFDYGISLIDKNLESNNSPFFILTLIEYYVMKMQEFLPLTSKLKIVETLLNRIDVEKLDDMKNAHRFVNALAELHIPKDKEDLRKKVNDLIKKLSEETIFKKTLVSNLHRLSEGDTYISNSTIYKNLSFMRELIKNEEFMQTNDRIIEKLISSAFNFLYNLDSESNISSEAITTIMSFADHVHNVHPHLPVGSMYGRLPTMVKVFNQNNINSNTLALASLDHLSRTNYPNLSYDSILLLEKVIRSEIPVEKKTSLVENYIKLDTDILENARSNAQKIQNFKICAILNQKNIHVPDEVIKNLKDTVMEKIIKNQDLDNIIRFNALLAFTNLKTEILNYREESKDYSLITKSLVQDLPIRKITRVLETLPRNLSNGLVNRFYIEFCSKYEKDPKVDKPIMMRILDKMTHIKWTNPSFYNKVISDYEKNFKFFNTSDHTDLINYFARVELNKEDVIRASASNINLKTLNEYDKFVLLNSLVKLGFTNQEWKELILEKLTQEIDFNTVLTKSNPKDRLTFIVNLWKLGDWPANNKQILDNAIQQVNKFGAPKASRSTRSQINYYEDLVLLIRRAPFFSEFETEFAKFMNNLFEAKKTAESKFYTFQMLVEFLKAMGHTDLEVFPADKHCEIYLPKTKTPIIFAKKNNVSIINNDEVNPTGHFVLQHWKNQGYSPVVVNEVTSWRNLLNEKDNVEIVKILESLNVPNLVTGDNYNFSSVDSIKKPANVQDKRGRRQGSSNKEEFEGDEE